jgi:hypothetical protein
MPSLHALQAWFLRRKRWWLSLGGLYLLYALFGFLILPSILQRKLVAALHEATHRDVKLAKVR